VVHARGGDNLAPLGPELLEGEERVPVDAARREQVGDRVTERGRRDRHRCVHRREQVDLDVAADAPPAEEGLREESSLVGGGGAREGQLRDEDPDDALLEVRERRVDPPAPLGAVEVEGHLVEAVHGLRGQLGAGRHHQRAVLEIIGGARRDTRHPTSP